jgi:hydrogenase-4 component B
MLSAEHAVAAALLLCFGGALVTLGLAGRNKLAGWMAFGVTAFASALVLVGAAGVLLHGPGRPVTLLAWESAGLALRFHVDGLSALFLGLIALVAVPAAFYSLEYMSHHLEHGVGRYYPNFLLFVGGMYGLVSATDMLHFFFVFWQIMTFSGWALIRFERRKPASEKAAKKYMVMMQLACGATMLGAAMLAQGAGAGAGGEKLMAYDFEAVAHHLPARLATEGVWVALAFGLFLVGFGIKMGMWPFGQVWLPDAHPAAPSPVSALLSGVMIKTGVYGLMRVFLWLVPAEAQGDFPLSAWGLVVAVLGTLTLFTGTVQALRQQQTKRLLAFSSIGQVGYILLGLGVCMTLLGYPGPCWATLAAAGLAGALLHTLNHAIFKSLLFLNAGAVLHATGTQDLDKLGGLFKHMPVTARTALVGSLAIAGVPLLSGFASKWGIYTAAIQGGTVAGLLPVLAAAGILVSALTLALFIKFFGAIFLARSSSLVAERSARRPRLEVGWKMRSAQAGLAGLCLLMGLMPALTIGVVQAALRGSRQGLAGVLADASFASGSGWLGLSSVDQQAVYAPLAVGLVLAGLFLLVHQLARSGGARRRVAAPWLCGYARETEANRYKAGHYFAALARYFRWVGGHAQPQPESEPSLAAGSKKEPFAWSLEKN